MELFNTIACGNIGDFTYAMSYIGKGAFSYVYKGAHKNSGEIVAIKKMDLASVDENIADHIKSEIDIMKKLNHKNIVKLHDVLYDDAGNVYLIMEYCKNGDLATFLAKKPLKEKYVKEYTKQIADAMEYLIKNKIIHRDLKPHNIMMTDINTIKITDFGFAKVFNSYENNLSKTICGSPIYMAPEIMMCNNYSIKTDLWSIGIILYEMLVGRPPYKACTHIELIKKIETQPVCFPNTIEISKDCKDLINHLLQKNPDKRISWRAFFDHIWLKGYKVDTILTNTKIDLTSLIIDYDEKKIKHRTKSTDNLTNKLIDKSQKIDSSDDSSDDSNDVSSDESCEEIVSVDIIPPKSAPISIKLPKKTSNNPTVSPMFNQTIAFTPNIDNSYVIVNSTNDDRIPTERSYSDSLISYMSNTINYLKSYYWW